MRGDVVLNSSNGVIDIENGKYRVTMKEAEDDEYKELIAAGKRQDLIIYIHINMAVTGRYITTYRKAWEVLNPEWVDEFFIKFLTDPEFRKPFNIDRKDWEGTVDPKDTLLRFPVAIAVKDED